MTYPYQQEKPKSIQSLFDTIAKSYDRTNIWMSLGLNHLWNQSLVNSLVETASQEPSHLLDLCAGTGAISFLFKKKFPTTPATLLDFSKEMLEVAKRRASLKKLDQLDFVEADAQKIPFPNQSFSHISLAYGIRNIHSPFDCALEAYRVLKPQGTFAILELTRPNNRLIKPLHGFYLRNVIPKIGKWITTNEEAYSYLSRSIGDFIAPNDLASMLKQAGFDSVSIRPLTFGSATLFIAKKR